MGVKGDIIFSLFAATITSEGIGISVVTHVHGKHDLIEKSNLAKIAMEAILTLHVGRVVLGVMTFRGFFLHLGRNDGVF